RNLPIGVTSLQPLSLVRLGSSSLLLPRHCRHLPRRRNKTVGKWIRPTDSMGWGMPVTQICSEPSLAAILHQVQKVREF
ncbi:hypothetical protein GIB67_009048, partial [Kingdonia uniflora]